MLSALSPSLRSTSWDTIAPGSQEWYTHLVISPTLEVVWSGVSNQNSAGMMEVQAIQVTRSVATVSLSALDYRSAALLVLDISDPAAPVQLAYVPDLCCGPIQLADHLAFVSDGNTVQIIDLSVPDQPTMAGRLDLPGGITDISLVAPYGYVLLRADTKADHGTLAVIDLHDLMKPTLLGSLSTDGLGQGKIQVVDQLVYVADDGPSVLVVDVSAPDTPRRAGAFSIDSELVQTLLGAEFKDVYLTAEAIAVHGERAYVGAGSNLLILDLHFPTAPVLVGSYPQLFYLTISDIAVSNDHVYLTSANWGSMDFGGLDVIDVSDPAHPKRISEYKAQANAEAVQVDERFIYVAHGRRGVIILRRRE